MILKSGATGQTQSEVAYVYDGWNVVGVYDTTTATPTFQKGYLWGEDLSGSLQGAGGVGGLLAEKRGGQTYLPVYDGNGNIMSYLNASTKASVAEYVYDAFGRTISSSGTEADNFTYRFSTKPMDGNGLYYYGYRYYDLQHGRWISRDPIEESGGVNLYGFNSNNGISAIDWLGLDDAKDVEYPTHWYGVGETVLYHFYETLYSPGRMLERMGRTARDNPWDLINPYSKRNLAMEGVNGVLDTAGVGLGVGVSFLSGDALDSQPMTGLESCFIFFNGISNTFQGASDTADSAARALGYSSRMLVTNRTTFNIEDIGVGDYLQILGNEFWMIEIVAIRGAQLLREADRRCPCIKVVAHSQGTMSFRRALDLVDTPDLRAKIDYIGVGGEAFNSASFIGLRCARNIWNFSDTFSTWDKVPLTNYLPSLDKGMSLPFLGPSTFGYDLFEYGRWELKTSKYFQEGGNHHSFSYYIELLRGERKRKNVR
ncbi:RHS repeat-associated core domain-containing protein [Victivallis sp. Marseille-Q1083]|uniref:RHS repeat-associated core domain-containing protein n=1 Tax=Victivallis sp. Marseille-Q1083 TaxID=2717288 RepID=UPI00158EBCDC|nr:RHS repeat-associated core domain-containing protein [Victivallis sp. Marseille-Q1083]